MTALTNTPAIEVTNRKTRGGRVQGWKYTVLEAFEVEDGVIEVDYAEADHYNDLNSQTTEAVYLLEHCIYNEMGTPEPRAYGIDMDKVNTIYGRTFDIKDWIKAQGFKWNGAMKAWVR